MKQHERIACDTETPEKFERPGPEVFYAKTWKLDESRFFVSRLGLTYDSVRFGWVVLVDFESKVSEASLWYEEI
jgi:hypothetical protein